MDVNGLTVVRTPHAIKVWDKHDMDKFMTRERKSTPTRGFEEFICPGSKPRTCVVDQSTKATVDTNENAAEGFSADRGTGQGDVTSPACWGAFFDILLTALALDAKDRETRWIRGKANLSYPAAETAYADDLLSFAKTPNELQRKADIVSAFCAIMGLQLSTNKLRRFVMVNSGMQDDTDTAITIVHNYGWSEVTIEAQDDGVLEYLGGKRDTSGYCKAALKGLQELVAAHCAETVICAASADTKVGCIEVSTYAKARYKAKLMSLTMAELKTIDKLLHKFHCKVLKQLQSFPYDLMYLNPERGGCGVKRFSDIANIDKLTELLRGSRRTDEVEAAASGVLQRVLRTNGLPLADHYRACFQHKRGSRHWLRSLLEWLQDQQLFLWRGGTAPTQTQLSCPIHVAFPNMSTQHQRRLRAKRLLHIGDIIDDTTGHRRWSVPLEELDLLTHTFDEPPKDNQLLLWEGQFWKPYVDIAGLRPTDVIEILHVHVQGTIRAAVWKLSERRAQQEWYTRSQEERNFKYSEIFGTRRQHIRVDQGGLKPGRNRCLFKNERTTPKPVIQVESQSNRPKWIGAARQFCLQQKADYRPVLYTDGSYSKTDLGLRDVFDKANGTTVANGSIVIMHAGDDWKQRPIFAIGIRHGSDIQATSAFTMEYLALAGALLLQRNINGEQTFTDCQAVYKIVCNRKTH